MHKLLWAWLVVVFGEAGLEELALAAAALVGEEEAIKRYLTRKSIGICNKWRD